MNVVTVIARNEATKQSILSLRRKMDCFALLAMTGHSITLARMSASGTKHSSYFPKIR